MAREGGEGKGRPHLEESIPLQPRGGRHAHSRPYKGLLGNRERQENSRAQGAGGGSRARQTPIAGERFRR